MRLIDADALEKFLKYTRSHLPCQTYTSAMELDIRDNALLNLQQMVHLQKPVDAVPVVRCKDCIYFQQEQIKTSEGTYRNKFPNEGMVSVDVGINIGSHCKRVVDVREEGFRDGEPTIERTYLWRNEDDFCSRGKRKTDDT